MRQFTKRDIQIRWGMQKADSIKTAYVFQYRNQKFTVRKSKFGAHPWTLHIPDIVQCGFHGMTSSYGTREIARQYAHNQIDAVFGKSVNKVLAEIF